MLTKMVRGMRAFQPRGASAGWKRKGARLAIGGAAIIFHKYSYNRTAQVDKV